MRVRLLVMGYWLSAIGSLSAQQPPLTAHPSPLTAEPGSELSVTLITFEPGGRLWERFGHNGLWIHDAAAGSDILYDYGRFSFDQPHFILRFLQGRTWYAMGFETNVSGLLAAYARDGRKIWAQELDLTPAQRVKLRDFLAWNIRPENLGYAYDSYRDNCSTRIRDALDMVVGGAIRRYAQQGSGMTWREETLRLNEHNPALHTGLLIALGHPVDVEMTRWEQMFLPIRLRPHLDSVRLNGPDGSSRPLVKSEQILEPGGRWPVPDHPSNWTWRYLLVGMLVGGLLLGVGRTRAFMPLATLWALVTGLLGGLLTWFLVFSHHVETYRNENILLLNLLALVLAIVLPSATRGKAWAIRPARRLAMLLAGLGVLALLLKLLPWFTQHNLEVIALVAPAHLGMWRGLERSLRSPSPS